MADAGYLEFVCWRHEDAARSGAANAPLCAAVLLSAGRPDEARAFFERATAAGHDVPAFLQLYGVALPG